MIKGLQLQAFYLSDVANVAGAGMHRIVFLALDNTNEIGIIPVPISYFLLGELT